MKMISNFLRSLLNDFRSLKSKFYSITPMKKSVKSRAIRLEDVAWKRNDDPRDWLNYKRLIWEETGSNDLCVGLGELPPGKILGLHHHEDDAEFYYVISGRAKVTVEDEEMAQLLEPPYTSLLGLNIEY